VREQRLPHLVQVMSVGRTGEKVYGDELATAAIVAVITCCSLTL
jgi:hypothetical protein